MDGSFACVEGLEASTDSAANSMHSDKHTCSFVGIILFTAVSVLDGFDMVDTGAETTSAGCQLETPSDAASRDGVAIGL